MGACTFATVASGPSAKAAFDTAVAEAKAAYGSRYTGSIAEKDSFTVITIPYSFARSEPGPIPALAEVAMRYAQHLIETQDGRIDDKYGPAGAIDLGEGEWLFFGWASE